MTQTTSPEAAPQVLEVANTITDATGEVIGEYSLLAIEGDNVTLDITFSLSSTADLEAAIAYLQQQARDGMKIAEEFRGER